MTRPVANLSSAEANLVKAKKILTGILMLQKNDAVARQTVDQAVAAFETNKSQVAVAKAGVLSAKTDLSYSHYHCTVYRAYWYFTGKAWARR